VQRAAIPLRNGAQLAGRLNKIGKVHMVPLSSTPSSGGTCRVGRRPRRDARDRRTRSMRKSSPRSGRHPQSHKTNSPPGCVHHARKPRVSRAGASRRDCEPNSVGARCRKDRLPEAKRAVAMASSGAVDEQLAPLLETAGGLSAQARQPRDREQACPCLRHRWQKPPKEPGLTTQVPSRIKPGP
jgi:hypothetical protein